MISQSLTHNYAEFFFNLVFAGEIIWRACSVCEHLWKRNRSTRTVLLHPIFFLMYRWSSSKQVSFNSSHLKTCLSFICLLNNFIKNRRPTKIPANSLSFYYYYLIVFKGMGGKPWRYLRRQTRVQVILTRPRAIRARPSTYPSKDGGRHLEVAVVHCRLFAERLPNRGIL